MEIVPNVHLVNGVRGGNVYLLVDDLLALIDTGMHGNAPRILSFIKELGRKPEELAHIFITHGHIDHAGSAAELRRLTGAKVVTHKDEASSEAGGYVLAPRSERSRGVILGALTYLGMCKSCPIDVPVTDGETFPYLSGLRVIHTPGHTHGSISLFLEKSEVLFVGDTIINNEDRLSRPLPFGSYRHQSEQSLMKLTGLKFSICCFGHGSPLTSEAHRKVTDFVRNYPSTPLWWRITRSWHRLIRFGRSLWSKKSLL